MFDDLFPVISVLLLSIIFFNALPSVNVMCDTEVITSRHHGNAPLDVINICSLKLPPLTHHFRAKRQFEMQGNEIMHSYQFCTSHSLLAMRKCFTVAAESVVAGVAAVSAVSAVAAVWLVQLLCLL